jgi:hypothetical protein
LNNEPVEDISKERYEQLSLAYQTTVVLTHTDLDGVVSGYLAEMGFDAQGVVSANYHEVSNKLNYIKKHYGDCDLVITDLHIEDKDLFYALKNFSTVKLFDHHKQTKKYHSVPEAFPKFELFFDESRCATKIVADHIIEKGTVLTDDQYEYVELVNIFDLWLHKEKKFPYSRILNDLYWRDGWKASLERLRNKGIPKIPDGLSKEDLRFARESFNKIAQVGQTAEWFSTEYGSTIVILESHQKPAINFIPQMMQSDTGIFYIIYYVNGTYKCSVRVDDTDSPPFEMGDTMQMFARDYDEILTAGGHDYAGAMSFVKDIKLSRVVELIELIEDSLHENDKKLI